MSYLRANLEVQCSSPDALASINEAFRKLGANKAVPDTPEAFLWTAGGFNHRRYIEPSLTVTEDGCPRLVWAVYTRGSCTESGRVEHVGDFFEFTMALEATR